MSECERGGGRPPELPPRRRPRRTLQENAKQLEEVATRAANARSEGHAAAMRASGAEHALLRQREEAERCAEVSSVERAHLTSEGSLQYGALRTTEAELAQQRAAHGDTRKRLAAALNDCQAAQAAKAALEDAMTRCLADECGHVRALGATVASVTAGAAPPWRSRSLKSRSRLNHCRTARWRSRSSIYAARLAPYVRPRPSARACARSTLMRLPLHRGAPVAMYEHHRCARIAYLTVDPPPTRGGSPCAGVETCRSLDVLHQTRARLQAAQEEALVQASLQPLERASALETVAKPVGESRRGEARAGVQGREAGREGGREGGARGAGQPTELEHSSASVAAHEATTAHATASLRAAEQAATAATERAGTIEGYARRYYEQATVLKQQLERQRARGVDLEEEITGWRRGFELVRLRLRQACLELPRTTDAAATQTSAALARATEAQAAEREHGLPRWEAMVAHLRTQVDLLACERNEALVQAGGASLGSAPALSLAQSYGAQPDALLTVPAGAAEPAAVVVPAQTAPAPTVHDGVPPLHPPPFCSMLLQLPPLRLASLNRRAHRPSCHCRTSHCSTDHRRDLL